MRFVSFTAPDGKTLWIKDESVGAVGHDDTGFDKHNAKIFATVGQFYVHELPDHVIEKLK